MKKVLAIILTVVMLFGVVAFNTSAEEATNPKVTLVTNAGSAVDQGVTTYFTVCFDNFNTIKGIDVTITADQYIELGTVTTYGFTNAAELGVNYTEENAGDEHTIRFVDLTGSADQCRISFAAEVPTDKNPTGNPTITVKGTYADSGKTLATNVVEPDDGYFELVKEIEPTKNENETAQDAQVAVNVSNETFVPQGAVYIKNGDNYIFATKDQNGNFIADKGAGTYEYKSYAVPANGITTFGASKDPEDNTRLRFGNYSKIDGDHGTMVFEGNWLALKNLYIKNGYTVQEFTEAIFWDVKTKLDASGKDYVYYSIPGEDDPINVYLFKQTKYMWKDDNAGILEYSIRLGNIDENKTYTGIAYTVNGEKATISQDVKSVDLTKLQAQ